jgi:hypothetical protein
MRTEFHRHDHWLNQDVSAWLSSVVLIYHKAHHARWPPLPGEGHHGRSRRYSGSQPKSDAPKSTKRIVRFRADAGLSSEGVSSSGDGGSVTTPIIRAM